MTHHLFPYLIILLAPLAAFATQIFFGPRIARKGDWVSTGAMGVVLLTSLMLAPGLIGGTEPVRISATWFSLGGSVTPLIQITVGLFADSLTGVMLVVVSLISFLVHLYSMGYMHGDKRYSRYYGYLSLFSFAMFGLILVDNFLLIYIFWELVGLGSYLLIGHYFERPAAASACKKAFLTTRVGDVGMFIGILILYAATGLFNFEAVFHSVAQAGGSLAGSPMLLTVAGVLIFTGAVGKSAQFPLHIWLPDAMEGPTPVSALIHAATMVAAGVYLVGRVFVLFTVDALLVIAYIGAITAFMAAFIAVTQKDIKRVLAYSTISQLGYMMLALGVGAYTAGLFHLVTHAFFKALLFLCSGSVIHALGTQDLFKMGGLRAKMPITCWTMTVGAIAISGVPFFSGFYSKDAILAGVLNFSLEHSSHMILAVIGFVTAGMTAFYMFRLIFLTFSGAPRDKKAFEHAHESPLVMTVPLMILAALSVGAGWGALSGGWFEHAIAMPHLSDYLLHAVHTGAGHVGDHHADGAHQFTLVASIALAAFGILAAAFAYYDRFTSKVTLELRPAELSKRFVWIYRLSLNKFYVDEFYSRWIVRPVLALANAFAHIFDLGVIDRGVDGAAVGAAHAGRGTGRFDDRVVDGAVNLSGTAMLAGGESVRSVQTGRLGNYFSVILIGLIVILAVYFVF